MRGFESSDPGAAILWGLQLGLLASAANLYFQKSPYLSADLAHLPFMHSTPQSQGATRQFGGPSGSISLVPSWLNGSHHGEG